MPALLLAAMLSLSVQDTVGDPEWPLELERLRPDYAAAKPYLEAEEARCEAELPGSPACLSIIYIHMNVAERDREYAAAAGLAERWLVEADKRGALEPRDAAFVRFRLAGFVMSAVRAGTAIPRVGYRLAIEQLTQAIEIYAAAENLPGEIAALRSKRAEAMMGLADDEIYDMERRAGLWELADRDLRAAIDLFAASAEPPSEMVLGNIHSDLARTLFERDLRSEAALFGQSAAAHYRLAIADVELRSNVAGKVRALAIRSLEAGYPTLAIEYYEIVLDIVLDEGRNDGVLFSVSDVMGYGGAFMADGQPSRAVEIYEIALADPGFTARPSNESFLRARLLRAMVADRQFDGIPAIAEASIAFADDQIAAGEYEAPLNAMKMHARAAWGEALVAQDRWAEAEPLLTASRVYRVRMAFTDPTERGEIDADLVLAKAVSRGSRNFALARTLLRLGMQASLASSERGASFDDASQAALRQFAPLFREQVRIAYALAKPEDAPSR